ncbi:MAG TPA: thioesterase family protein, partial [Vitreimonas sp.]|nr:thioesterase family protein [Vitreimonas sp.]
TAALLLKSVLVDPRAEGEASAINVNYVSRIVPKSELEVRVRPLGGGRSVMTWRTEIFADGGEDALATGHVVLTSRRDGTAFTEFTRPAAPDPETLTLAHPPAAFGQCVDMRAWRLPFGNDNSHYANWIRERSGHPVDHVLLAYLSDAYPPRIMGRGPGPRGSSTLTLSAYFFATAAELAAIGGDYILNESVGTRAEGSTIGSQLRMWSRAGALLATSEQLCWFK